MPVRKTTPDKTHNFQWHMFQIHVAPQPLGTVHYLPLLLLTSFLRNYYSAAPHDARIIYHDTPPVPTYRLTAVKITKKKQDMCIFFTANCHRSNLMQPEV